MLTDLDETLMHQVSLPFEYAQTSDHRFYDRYYISTFAPDGRFALINGMGVYKNMNVMDGFAATRSGVFQRNRRFSRALRPNLPGMRMELGPLRAEILEPFKKARYVCEADGDADSYDLTFDAFLPPHLENHHVSRGDGRLHTDYWRQSQLGHVNGSLRIGGETVKVENWFMWRDHSWGVRPGVGGFEPTTGMRAAGSLPSAARAGGLGMIIFGVAAATPSTGCIFQLQENEHGQAYYLDGNIAAPGQAPSEIVSIEHDVVFQPGSRLYKSAQFRLKTADGRDIEVATEAVGTAWTMRGAGYDSGYADGKGMGVYRSEAVVEECDIYDLSQGDEVIMPNGERVVPRHRERNARITINGEPGCAHAVIMAVGRNKKYGLA